jgi:ABC-type Co2+ transport system permease subunit
MQILVIAATAMEIAPFTEAALKADLLITGVGAPATGYYLLKKLHQSKYDLVIQAGIGGTFSVETAALGSTVCCSPRCFCRPWHPGKKELFYFV